MAQLSSMAKALADYLQAYGDRNVAAIRTTADAGIQYTLELSEICGDRTEEPPAGQDVIYINRDTGYSFVADGLCHTPDPQARPCDMDSHEHVQAHEGRAAGLVHAVSGKGKRDAGSMPDRGSSYCIQDVVEAGRKKLILESRGWQRKGKDYYGPDGSILSHKKLHGLSAGELEQALAEGQGTVETPHHGPWDLAQDIAQLLRLDSKASMDLYVELARTGNEHIKDALCGLIRICHKKGVPR